MADLVVPQLGESISEAVVSRWLKQVGDDVAVDEPVVELETDKITVELPSPVAGVLTTQGVKDGATVKVGQVVGAVEAGQAKAKAKASAPIETADAKPEAKADAKPEAKADAKPEAKAEPKADAKPQPKADAKKPAPAPPRSQREPARTGEIHMESGNGKQVDKEIDKDALLKLTPSQRATAREAGQLPNRAPAAASGGGSAAPASGPSAEERLAAVDERDEVVPMSSLRKRVAERLVQAQHESASLTTFNEVDMSAVLALRAKYKDSFEKTHKVKLGFMSFFVKACVHAAKLFPGVNAELIGGSIVYKKHYDFGIAVSAPKGLVVPVLRDCDALSFSGIEQGIAELAEKAKTGKLTMNDLTGGTFSITNGGIFGSMMSTPLLNYPQTGILGMHNIVKRAVVVDDAIVVRPMMYVALSYDHRVVDGREAVSFLVAVKDRLEAPDRMLIEV